MDTAQIVIRVGRGKSEEMGTADRREMERIRLGGDNSLEARIDGHGVYSRANGRVRMRPGTAGLDQKPIGRFVIRAFG